MSYRKSIREKDILNPERIFANLLKDYVDGVLDDCSVLYKAVVVKIDNIGGQLETNPPNPKHSIQARVLTNARDKDLEIEELPVFWPMFSHDVLPVKEGEYIYVMYEDNNDKSHGLWLARSPEPHNTNNINLVQGSLKYLNDSNNDLNSVGSEKITQEADLDIKPLTPSSEFVVEKIPDFISRVGDRVVQGSNNTIIVLGRDRPSDVSSGNSSSAGTIDIVAGRVSEDMNLDKDKSRIYISMNSDIDGNFNIKIGDSSSPSACIGIKSDQIRIIARNGMKILVEDGNLTIDANKVYIGKDASYSGVMGEKLKTILENLIDQISILTVTSTSPGTPSSPPLNVTNFQSLKTQLQTFLSDSVKIKS